MELPVEKIPPRLESERPLDLRHYKYLFKSIIKLSLIVFVVYVIYLFIALYMKMGKNSPVLISGETDASKEVRVTSGALPLSEVDDGMSWTFVMWLYVDDFTHNQMREKSILEWGTNNVSIVFAKDTNDMVIRIGEIPNKNRVEPMIEEVRIPNIPLQKWFNATIILDNRNVDCFLDGVLVQSRLLKRVPRYVADDLVLFKDKGFQGKAGYIQYMNYRIPQYGITHFTQMSKRFNNTSILYSLYHPIFFTFVYGAKLFLMTLLILFNRFYKVLHVITIDVLKTLWDHITFLFNYAVAGLSKVLS